MIFFSSFHCNTEDHDDEALKGQVIDPGTNSELLLDLEELGQGGCNLL